MEGSRATGDIHFSPGNSGDEKLLRASTTQVTGAINQLLGTKQLPATIRVIWDRTTPWDTEIQGNTTVVNAAQTSTPEQAQQAILRERMGDIWYQPEAQTAWQYVRSNLTPEELTATLKSRKARGLPTDTPTVQDEAAIARLMNSDGRDRIARNFHNALRIALNQRFGFNIPATAHPQLKEAAIQFCAISAIRKGRPHPACLGETQQNLQVQAQSLPFEVEGQSIVDTLDKSIHRA